jgi:DNA polymerase-3 subunit gamma/tau
MSYLVLARKYRPQTFDEIVGQAHVTATLKSAITQGRLHHAFLFCGARGVGKTTAARILAKALSCERAPTAEPCNECEPCREITSGASVDVQEIDAASNNGVDNIRELRDAIRYAPVRGKKKVYILDEVHMLSSGAWNALLKTLEEPPPHAIFVFATTDPHKLPATILSRVQRYNFKLVGVRTIGEHLGAVLGKEGIHSEPAALTLIARESGGSVRDALSLTDQVLAGAHGEALTEARVAEVLGVADRALVAGLLAAIVDKRPETALRFCDEAFRAGYDLTQLAHTVLAALRDLVVAVSVKDAAALGALVDGAAEELDALVQLGQRTPPTLPEILFQRFSRSVELIARAPSARHALEVGLVELCRAEPLEPIAGLIDRLVELEGTLGDSPAPTPSRSPSPPPSTSPSPSPSPSLSPSPSPSPPLSPSPPASPRAPAPFTALVEHIIAKAPRLSVLSQGRCVEHSPDRLAITFDRDFDADALRERVALLRETVLAITSTSPTIEIIVGSAEDVTRTETLIEVEQRRVDEDRERRRQESLEHPVRKALDQRFGGTWKEPVVDLDQGTTANQSSPGGSPSSKE